MQTHFIYFGSISIYLPNFKLWNIDCKCNMGNLTADMEKNQEDNRWKEKAKGVGSRIFFKGGILYYRIWMCSNHCAKNKIKQIASFLGSLYPYRYLDKPVCRVHLPSPLGPVPAFPLSQACLPASSCCFTAHPSITSFSKTRNENINIPQTWSYGTKMFIKN